MLKAALSVLLLLPLAAHAQKHMSPTDASGHPTTGYTPANAAGCKVWVPLQLHAPDYVPRYTGACTNGVAQGKGSLQWLYTYAEMRPKTTWDGFFQNGVYVGDAPLNHEIEPQPNSNDYWVRFGPMKAGDLLVIAQNDSDGRMDLCAPSMINVSLNSHTPATDDTAVRQAFTDAGTRLQTVCRTMRHSNTQVNAFTEPYKLDSNNHRPQITADASINWSNGSLSGYSNRASQAAQSQQNTASRDAKLAASRKRFDDFTIRNHISAWVTATQLDENPFKFEGKTVGLLVQLDRMLSPDTALVTGGLEEDSGSVQLHGITPDFPDHTHTVLLAARVGKREPVVGASYRATITPITRLDSATCTRDSCYDWLDWTRGEERIHWGDPYTPAAR